MNMRMAMARPKYEFTYWFVRYLANKYNFSQKDEYMNFMQMRSNQKHLDKNAIDFIRDEFEMIFGISAREFLGKSRKTDLVTIRHLFRYVCVLNRVGTLSEIGKASSGDHSVVLHSMQVIRDKVDIKDSIIYPKYLLVKHLIK